MFTFTEFPNAILRRVVSSLAVSCPQNADTLWNVQVPGNEVWFIVEVRIKGGATSDNPATYCLRIDNETVILGADLTLAVTNYFFSDLSQSRNVNKTPFFPFMIPCRRSIDGIERDTAVGPTTHTIDVWAFVITDPERIYKQI
jgi:hypothetical protein